MRISSTLATLFLLAPALAQTTPPSEPASQQPAGQAAAEAPKEGKKVKVTAEGYNADDALRQALRKALEEGAGAQLASFSKVENFALARDTIYSRSFGIVSEYKVLKQEETAGGGIEVTLEAIVRSSAVAQAWAEIQNVLDQIGRPRIMVWIDESIDGRAQPDSIVASRLEEMFVKAGFDLVQRQAVEDVIRRESADAEREGNAAKVAALAKNAGAHILIRGSANADRAGVESLYGVPAAFYNCDVQARVYYTDTGRLLASESLPSTRAGVRSRKEFSPQAARSALVQATFPEHLRESASAGGVSPRRDRPYLAMKLYEAVLEQWSVQISAGGEITLEVEGLEFGTFVKLKKALSELERIESVNADFSKNIGSFRIRAKVSADTLAERLTEAPFKEWLEIIDLKPNRIQAKKPGAPAGGG